MIAFSLVAGLICALGWLPLVLMMTLVLLWVAGFLVASFLGWRFKDYLLLSLMFLFFFGNLIQSNTGVPIGNLWQGFIFTLGFLGLAAFGKFAFSNTQLKISGAFFFLFLGICMLSAFITGYSNKESFFSQLLADLKLILFMSFGVFLVKEIDFPKWINNAILIYIPVALIFLLVQWIFPGIYQKLFAGIQLHNEATDFGLSRGQSVFTHSSHFAGVSALLAIFPLTRIVLKIKVSTVEYIKLFILFLFVIAAQQRQELMSLIIVGIIIYLFGSKTSWAIKIISILIFSTISMTLYLVMFWSVFDAEFATWGIGSAVHAITHPRALLYDGAFTLAQENFPFGSGMGTYGGVGSMKYNLAVYFKLGFAKAWWWKDYANYLVDTYWPNSIGEAGYIGAFFLLMHYLFIALFGALKLVKGKLEESQKLLWICFLAGFCWLLLTTPTSPGFQEALLIFIPGLYFGAAVSKEKLKGH